MHGSLSGFIGTVSFTAVGLFPNALIDTTPDSFTFTGLSAGFYALGVMGTWGSSGLNIYTGSVYQPAAAVPEPESYALALAGLGVAGFVMRRRRKAA